MLALGEVDNAAGNHDDNNDNNTDKRKYHKQKEEKETWNTWKHEHGNPGNRKIFGSL